MVLVSSLSFEILGPWNEFLGGLKKPDIACNIPTQAWNITEAW